MPLLKSMSFLVVLVALVPLCRAGAPAAQGARRRPRVYITPRDVGRAKENIVRFARAKQIADAIRRETDSWLAKDDDWLREAAPHAGAAFVCGLTGCPISDATILYFRIIEQVDVTQASLLICLSPVSGVLLPPRSYIRRSQ